jgi:hypothetical protein
MMASLLARASTSSMLWLVRMMVRPADNTWVCSQHNKDITHGSASTVGENKTVSALCAGDELGARN